MFNILTAIYFWIWLCLYTCFLFMIMAGLRLVYLLLGRRFDLVAHKIGIIWGRGLLFAMPRWHLELSGLEHLPPANQAVVIVANHQSMSDIWALYCLNIQFRWLSKASVFNIPLIGQAMRWSGYIPIVRGDKASHVEALKASANWLRNGMPMLFFPEGTRTESGPMRGFKIGAFKLAAEVGVPIQPIALCGARELMYKGSAIPGQSTVRIRVLPTVHRNGDETLDQYADRVRNLIAQALEKIR